MNGQDPNQTNNLNANAYGATSLGGVSPTPMPQDPNVGVLNPTPMPDTLGVSGVNPQPVVDSNAVGATQLNQTVNTPDLNAGMQAPDSTLNANPNVGVNQGVSTVNSQPVAQPIPGTEGLTGNTVASGGMANPTPGNANGFVESRKPENIGVVPPPLSNDSKKQKKGFNKVLFVILILALIAGIAYGLYYFLVLSSDNSRNITANTVTIGINETLTFDIEYYASGDINGCTPNLGEVDTSEIGQYEYSITCDGETAATGIIFVADISAPVVELNTVFKSVGETVTIDDFVVSCTDPSNCTTEFSNEAQVTEYLATAGGPYEVSITASDTAGNEQEYIATLYVTEYSIVAYTNFTSAEVELSDYSATKIVNDILPIGRADGDTTLIFLGVAIREYTYTFESSEEYLSVIADKQSTITFDGVTGSAKYDDDNYILTITADLSIDTLNAEAGGTFPTSYSEFISLYTANGYSVSNKTTLN